MFVEVFRRHGEFCASHPWEVIVGTLTLTACIFSLDKPQNGSPSSPVLQSAAAASQHCGSHRSCLTLEEYNAVDVIVMTLIRCITVLYSYYQFCNLHKLGSKYILGIAGLFTVFSSFVFTSSVINFMKSDITDLKDALFFFLLLIDLSKATVLAQFALSASSQEEVKNNIARGMALLGPTITLDTIVETLVISVGTLSGVKRLEVLCYFACLSVVVNYIVFVTFYPACLSLILELSRSGEVGHPAWHNKSLIMKALREEDQKPNPVVQRVKLIMSAGLVIVHAHSRWALRGINGDEEDLPLVGVPGGDHINTNTTDDAALQGYLMRWVRVSADQIVILILLLALTVKFIFFEDKEELAEQFLMSSVDDMSSTEHRNLDAALRTKYTPSLSTNEGLVMNDSNNELWLETPSSKHQRLLAIHCQDKLVQTDPSVPIYNIAQIVENKIVQTDGSDHLDSVKKNEDDFFSSADVRALSECLAIYKAQSSASLLTDKEVRLLVNNGDIPGYQLEKACDNCERGVGIRRQLINDAGRLSNSLANLPYKNYDYSKVMGACCENVIGYMPVPVGVAGPLRLDDQLFYIPMATTEGCLVASTNRGSRALINCGVRSRVVADGMTRGPVVRFNSITRASEAMAWMQQEDNFNCMKESFDSTSRFARLNKIHVVIAGRHLFIRFVATTGDAMGMNMISKGTEVALKFVQRTFPDMELLSLSGNFCSDKKPAAVNWIEGRGKSVVCEAIVPSNVVRNILKTTVQALVDVNISKNMIGSAVAGSIGGFNAHAANIVTAIYIATGQDPAQNVGSSNCMTLMEPWGEDGNDLYISCTMPSIEIGTIGGGTQLSPQAACLEMLGVKGANEQQPGENANKLARIVCGTVLAGELSLMSALAAGHLVRSHLKHNRSSANISTMGSNPRSHHHHPTDFRSLSLPANHSSTS